MTKESLEMLFRELRALEYSPTAGTQVYQVATRHHTCTHSTSSLACTASFHANSLPILPLPPLNTTLCSSLPPHHTNLSCYCLSILILTPPSPLPPHLTFTTPPSPPLHHSPLTSPSPLPPHLPFTTPPSPPLHYSPSPPLHNSPSPPLHHSPSPPLNHSPLISPSPLPLTSSSLHHPRRPLHHSSPLPSPPLPQTAEAVAVLQARQLILSTLTHWPWGAQKVIRLPLVFGSQDIMKTFGMIDLISNMEPADDVNKVLYARPTHVVGVCSHLPPLHTCTCT